jgi:guanylate kinase
MNRLIVLSAPSGAGKTSLCKRLLADFQNQMELSISSTTRAPRGTEKNGVEYHFLSQDEFKNSIDRSEFAEWAFVHGNYYGTSKKVLEKTLSQGKSVLLDIDVQGAASLKQAFPKSSTLIFIAPPSMEELERRLRSRNTDDEPTIQRRLRNAQVELEQQTLFDHVVLNDQFERAYHELKTLVERALHD